MSTYLQSLQQSLHSIFSQDPLVYLLGEDILDPYGGAFKVSQGLSSTFPGRVLTTPISEGAILGVANGMALRGLKPIVEIMFGDFITLAADQLINYTAKFRPMYRKQVHNPLVVRTPMGGGRGYGPTHSQSLEKMFLGIPHLHVVAPSVFHDPGQLLEQAVLRDPDPVLFIEHKLLYPTQKIDGYHQGLTVESCEEKNGYPSALVRNYLHGKPDATLITYGGSSLMIPPLFEKMATEEIRLLACVPSSLQPPPIETLAACAAESGRVILIEEGSRSFGWGAEIAASLSEKLWRQLQHPIRRIGAADTILPATRALESMVLPNLETIEKTLFEVIA